MFPDFLYRLVLLDADQSGGNPGGKARRFTLAVFCMFK